MPRVQRGQCLFELQCDKYQQQKVGEDPLLSFLQELGEYMTMGICKAELEVKYTVVVMYDGDEVSSESGDNEFDSVSANAKEGGVVIKNGSKRLNTLHTLIDFNNM